MVQFLIHRSAGGNCVCSHICIESCGHKHDTVVFHRVLINMCAGLIRHILGFVAIASASPLTP